MLRARAVDLAEICGLLFITAGLVVFPSELISAAKSGVELCLTVMLPSLFPFFVLSNLSVRLGFADKLGKALAPVMRPVFNVSGAGAAALALGFVGGYPVGAKTVISLYKSGRLTKTEAERMLAYANNSGPAFILGVVGTGIFAERGAGLALYLVHALSSLIIGILFRFYKRGEKPEPASAVSESRESAVRAFIGSVGDGLGQCLSISAFACALSFAGGLMAFGRLALDKSINPDGTLPRCVRAIAPSFGRTVREEAEASYEEMVSRRPESEAEAKKQKRFAENPRYLVIWALENKVRNSPEPVRSGGEYRVKFPLPEGAGPCSVRVRCPLLAGIRSTFGGEFTFGGEKSAVSSVPSTEVEIPFSHPAPDGKGEAEFVFSNNTGRMVFLRPRRDLTLLVPHGGFFANFLMAVLAWTGIVSVFSAIAAAMSSALSKPVAVFGSVALLLALLVAPVSSAQIPDPAEMSFIDIASLCVTHWLAVAIEPVASVSPAGSLAENTAIEASVLARLLLGGCLILPALLSPLAAVAARAKPQD